VLVDDSISMGISDASGTRSAAAKSVLDNGMLKSLSEKFQVRLYKFGKDAERIQKTEQLTRAAASRLGDTLEHILAESFVPASGAIVLLSDGADNAGGIDLETIAGIRRQRIRCTLSDSARSTRQRMLKSPTWWWRRAHCRNPS
jgi:hypothetical protein